MRFCFTMTRTLLLGLMTLGSSLGWVQYAFADIPGCETAANSDTCQEAMYAYAIKVKLAEQIDTYRTEIASTQAMLAKVISNETSDESLALYHSLQQSLIANHQARSAFRRLSEPLVAFAAQAQSNIRADLHGVASGQLDVTSAYRLILQEILSATQGLSLRVVEQVEGSNGSQFHEVRLRPDANTEGSCDDALGAGFPISQDGPLYVCGPAFELDAMSNRFIRGNDIRSVLYKLHAGETSLDQLRDDRLMHVELFAQDVRVGNDAAWISLMNSFPLARVDVAGGPLGQVLSQSPDPAQGAALIQEGLEVLLSNLAEVEENHFEFAADGERIIRANDTQAAALMMFADARANVLSETPAFMAVDQRLEDRLFELTRRQERVENLLFIATAGSLGLWGLSALFPGTQPFSPVVGLATEVIGGLAAGYSMLRSIKRLRLLGAIKTAAHTGIEQSLVDAALVTEAWQKALRGLAYLVFDAATTVVGHVSAWRRLGESATELAGASGTVIAALRELPQQARASMKGITNFARWWWYTESGLLRIVPPIFQKAEMSRFNSVALFATGEISELQVDIVQGALLDPPTLAHVKRKLDAFVHVLLEPDNFAGTTLEDLVTKGVKDLRDGDVEFTVAYMVQLYARNKADAATIIRALRQAGVTDDELWNVYRGTIQFVEGMTQLRHNFRYLNTQARAVNKWAALFSNTLTSDTIRTIDEGLFGGIEALWDADAQIIKRNGGVKGMLNIIRAFQTEFRLAFLNESLGASGDYGQAGQAIYRHMVAHLHTGYRWPLPPASEFMNILNGRIRAWRLTSNSAETGTKMTEAAAKLVSGSDVERVHASHTVLTYWLSNQSRRLGEAMPVLVGMLPNDPVVQRRVLEQIQSSAHLLTRALKEVAMEYQTFDHQNVFISELQRLDEISKAVYTRIQTLGN